MRNSKYVLSMIILALIAMMLVTLAPAGSHASSVVKSKSNIANNRSAAPIGESKSGPWDVVVLCESCTFPGLPEDGHLVLMDSQTGQIWAYSNPAVVGQADPICLGTLPAVGKRIVPCKPSGSP
jgi:hypothetical protein